MLLSRTQVSLGAPDFSSFFSFFFFRIDLLTFFSWFWHQLWMTFFDDFPMFFASHVWDVFVMFFWSFPNRFLNRANHEIIKNPLVLIGLFALGTFRTLPIFQRISIQKTSNFRMDFSWNSWPFRHRFSHRFVHRFLMENGSQKAPISSLSGEGFCSLFATFSEDRSRLPAAIVPPPGLGKIMCMRKICKKIDARSMQVYFFAKYCLKKWISPKTSQNETPRVQNNQNMTLHGTKRGPDWAKRTPKWTQRVPKGTQFEPKGYENEPRGCQRGAKSGPESDKKTSKIDYLEKGRFWEGARTKFWAHFLPIFDKKCVQKSMRKTMPEKTAQNIKMKQKTRHDPTPKNQDSHISFANEVPPK